MSHHDLPSFLGDALKNNISLGYFLLKLYEVKVTQSRNTENSTLPVQAQQTDVWSSFSLDLLSSCLERNTHL